MTLEISKEEFKSLVIKDVRKESDDLLEVLSSDFRSWLDELNILLRDVEIQLAAQKSKLSDKKVQLGPEWNNNEWYTFKASEDKWKVTALRFKASVEERIRFVKTLRAKQNLSAQ